MNTLQQKLDEHQTIEGLITKVKTYLPDIDTTMLVLAYDFADKAHQGQNRASGLAYITHPLATAYNLADLKSDYATIVAGLLHDVPEDTEVTLAEIEKNFGKEVAKLVNGITKLGRIKYRGIERYAENLRKMFIAMAKDIRVIFIKFADRLHNLQTLSYLPPEKQKRIAMETLEIYTPIADRLGMSEIKHKLEDLAFSILFPAEYEWVLSLRQEPLSRQIKNLEKIKKILAKHLSDENINYISIHGRTKRIYSLYKKLLQKDRDINRIYDLIALRVIVPNIQSCYTTIGIIHGLWLPLKGKIKDYIATPKPNGYQSIHTTVFANEGQIIEFQIRTSEMHEQAEYGIAAHWHYKEKGSMKIPEKQAKWIKELLDIQKKVKDSEQYLQQIKLDLFNDRIFIFTPKGDVIELPEDATPIDFAYHVHTDMGNKCMGAKINDQIASLDTKLKSGDMVEILLDKNRKKPNEDWARFVKTKTAKDHIRQAVNKNSHSLWRFKSPFK
jgi:GTP pyrophosphokinase